jgi:glycosyltransferase involved in cell wall biosynthesis
LDNIGGGEKVLLELSKLYDNPTIYTLWANKEITEKLDFPVKVSFLQHFPTKFRRTIGLFLMPFAWKTFESELKSFDLIINSSWAFAHSAGGNHPRKISYIHTPGRYWWYPSIDQRTKVRVPGFLLSIIRRKDFNLAQKTNVYVANSLETKKRILECWGRESEVVYPPVNLDFYKPSDFNRVGEDRFVRIKNLILTNQGERLFQPNIGSDIRRSLFEPLDRVVLNDIREAISSTIKYNELELSDIAFIIASLVFSTDILLTAFDTI